MTTLYEEVFEGKGRVDGQCCENCVFYSECEKEHYDRLTEEGWGELEVDVLRRLPEYRFDDEGWCDEYRRDGQSLYEDLFGKEEPAC